ncbi:conserved protein of unknown function [Rhodovastum atsumiense]|uniref:Uncharacterized protein n=1 Tax=Rhodovastum atsumiense TaxID=504468 RepID=A0A5M6IRV8_9PROT|nr:hypothetical protein [Rhodovastum atsumiense]KAA5611012.1 hypothetical protein F1189_16510 [Rhodovastum atsumiense]CAH2600205.1 conserved protein of unknown function [Rhodovastum atsumiense]
MTVAPIFDFDAEANEACVQAVPGAVFLRLRRNVGGDILRRMFVEMTPQQARALSRDLQSCIRKAERNNRRLSEGTAG